MRKPRAQGDCDHAVPEALYNEKTPGAARGQGAARREQSPGGTSCGAYKLIKFPIIR